MPDSVECMLGNIQARMEDMSTKIDGLTERVRDLEDTILSAKVGWRAFITIGSAGAALVSFLVWLIHTFWDQFFELVRTMVAK